MLPATPRHQVDRVAHPVITSPSGERRSERVRYGYRAESTTGSVAVGREGRCFRLSVFLGDRLLDDREAAAAGVASYRMRPEPSPALSRSVPWPAETAVGCKRPVAKGFSLQNDTGVMALS